MSSVCDLILFLFHTAVKNRVNVKVFYGRCKFKVQDLYNLERCSCSNIAVIILLCVKWFTSNTRYVPAPFTAALNGGYFGYYEVHRSMVFTPDHHSDKRLNRFPTFPTLMRTTEVLQFCLIFMLYDRLIWQNGTLSSSTKASQQRALPVQPQLWDMRESKKLHWIRRCTHTHIVQSILKKNSVIVVYFCLLKLLYMLLNSCSSYFARIDLNLFQFM